MHPLLQDYPVVVPCPVDWGQMDAFEHVNNIIYFRYFENARVAYGLRIGITDHIKTLGIGPILAHTECKFIRPLFFPDTALTGARITGAHGSEMTMEYKVVSEQRNEVAALGSSLGVYYHYREQRRLDMPADLIARIEQLEGRVLPRTIPT